jgi:hypothetical protein
MQALQTFGLSHDSGRAPRSKACVECDSANTSDQTHALSPTTGLAE